MMASVIGAVASPITNDVRGANVTMGNLSGISVAGGSSSNFGAVGDPSFPLLADLDAARWPRFHHGRPDGGDQRADVSIWRHIGWWISAAVVAMVRVYMGDDSTQVMYGDVTKADATTWRRSRRDTCARPHGRRSVRLPWAPRVRWALIGRRVGGRRVRRRSGRIRGTISAIQLGGDDSCGASWRPWKSGRDGDGVVEIGTCQDRGDGVVSDMRMKGGDHVEGVDTALTRTPCREKIARGDDRSNVERPCGRPWRRRGGCGRYAAIMMSMLHWGSGRGADAAAATWRGDAGPELGGPVQVCAKWKQVVDYPEPHRDGFRDVLTPGHDDAGPGPGKRQPSEEFSLVVETVNATGWGPLSRRLEDTRAQVVLGQETWILQGQMARVSDWCRKRGWKAILAPASIGPGGGASGGVAIFGRVGVGLRYPQVGSHILEDARAVAGTIHPPGHRPTTVVSVYLRDGRGVKEENKGTLARVGQCAAAQGPGNLFLCGGDFQCDPESIERSGFPQQVQGRIVAAASSRGTFRTRATASTLDFFCHQQ